VGEVHTRRMLATDWLLSQSSQPKASWRFLESWRRMGNRICHANVVEVYSRRFTDSVENPYSLDGGRYNLKTVFDLSRTPFITNRLAKLAVHHAGCNVIFL
jgi:hypothetical protein